MGKTRRPTFDEIFEQLSRFETVEATAIHFNVSSRTIKRAIKNKAEHHHCWHRIGDALITTVDAEAKASSQNK